jgi:hypothetical protein
MAGRGKLDAGSSLCPYESKVLIDVNPKKNLNQQAGRRKLDAGCFSCQK